MYWFLISAALLIATAGFLLLSHSHSVEDRCQSLEREFAALRARQDSDHQTALGIGADASEQARRAHVRLDNHDRQIAALGHDIGWSDEKAHTRVLTGRERVGGSLPQRELAGHHPITSEGSRGPGWQQKPKSQPPVPDYEELFGKNELDELLSKKA